MKTKTESELLRDAYYKADAISTKASEKRKIAWNAFLDAKAESDKAFQDCQDAFDAMMKAMKG